VRIWPLLLLCLFACKADLTVRINAPEDSGTPIVTPAAVVAPAPTAQVPDTVPYPEAQAPSPFPAMAMSPDSDCGGVIDLSPFNPNQLRAGVWTIGTNWAVPGEPKLRFDPILYFNTKKAALDCAGSNLKVSAFEVRHWVNNSWVR
jgi:hypothetical protein